jgi:hypothetical protein
VSECHDLEVEAWRGLGPEEYAVMITAADEGSLIDVMDSWRARQRWAETGSTRTPSDLDDTAKVRLVARFGDVVLELVQRGWLEVREPHDAPEPLQGVELRKVLSDPASWVFSYDYDHRMAWPTCTDAWDRLVEAQ